MEFFSRLGLADPLAAALDSFGFGTPTPVQIEAIPIILSRRDAIIESETGTGKTFAYLAPAFQLVSVLERKGVGEPGVIVAAPTQELAVQIGRESERLAKAAGLSLKTVVLLGGTPLEKQAAKLKAKPEIIVGTLGRLADLVSLGKLRTGSLKLLVLDEADRLFANETEDLARALLKSAPSSCARVLVSATIPERIRRELRPLLRDAAEICPVGETVLSESIEHWCFYCDGRKRLDFTRRFEAAVHPEKCLVFLTMATRVEKAALALAALGLPVGAIHSGMDKETRRVALERFAGGELRYLLTSDLGARGLDIPGITHVISLDLPDEPTVYTHRAGRTGRAGALGVSIVLADGVELARASKIATKGGFVFRCKVLEEGQVLEPTSEEFFARATAAEEQRMAAKAAHVAGDPHRGLGFKRRDAKSPSSSYPREKDSTRRESPRFAKSASERPASRPSATRGFPELRGSKERVPAEPEVEGERTARKPRSAPWRESSGMPSPAPHSMLYKKDEVPKRESVERRSPEPRGDAPRSAAPRPASRGDRPTSDRPYGGRPTFERPRGPGGRPSPDRPHGADSRGDRPHGAGAHTAAPRPASRGDRPTSDRPHGDRPTPERQRSPGAGRPSHDRPHGADSRGDRPQSDRPRASGDQPHGAGAHTAAPRPASRGDRPTSNRPHGDRPTPERQRSPGAGRPSHDRPHGADSRGDRPQSDRPRASGNQPHGAGAHTAAPRPASRGDRPTSNRPYGDHPTPERPRGPGAGRPSHDRPHGADSRGDRPHGAPTRAAPRPASRGARPTSEQPHGDRPTPERPRSGGKPRVVRPREQGPAKAKRPPKA